MFDTIIESNKVDKIVDHLFFFGCVGCQQPAPNAILTQVPWVVATNPLAIDPLVVVCFPFFFLYMDSVTTQLGPWPAHKGDLFP